MSMVTFSHQTYNETQYWNVEVLNSEVCVFLQKSLFMLHIYLRYLTPGITRGLVWTSWNYTKNKQPLHDKQIKRAWVHWTEERGVESSARSPARSFRSGSRIKQREGEPRVFGCRSSGSSGKTKNEKQTWIRDYMKSKLDATIHLRLMCLHLFLVISTFMIHLLCFLGCSKHSSYRWTCHPSFCGRSPTKLTTRGAVIGPDCHRMPLKVQGLRLDEMTGDGEGRVSR